MQQAARPRSARSGRGARAQMPAQPTSAAAPAATPNRSDDAELPPRKSSRLSVVGRKSRGDREEAEERQSRRRSGQAAAIAERQLLDKTPATPIERPAGKISLWCDRCRADAPLFDLFQTAGSDKKAGELTPQACG